MPKNFVALLATLQLLFLASHALPEVRMEPNAKKFTDQDCQWLYSQFLGECISIEKCTSRYENFDFSISTSQGLGSLETVITVRVMDAIISACERACSAKTRPPIEEWRKTICKPLMRK